MCMVMMATALDEPLPVRQIIRDAIAAQLLADGYSITTDKTAHTIALCPINRPFLKESNLTFFNIPMFLIVCDENAIIIKNVRPTSIRTIAYFEYADPLLMENLAEALQPLGICLVV